MDYEIHEKKFRKNEYKMRLRECVLYKTINIPDREL